MSAIKVVEVEDDYNIQEAWNRACGAFAQTTKVNLTESPKYSVDEVLDQIRAKQDEDDEKSNKFRVAKDVIGKTLKFITVLGGIAAQGASMVFAPSSLCFNAISYLIQTGAKYKRIFSSLAELFRKVSDVLERCKIYLRLPAEAVDIALRKIINEELVCFVDICALSIKVLKGNKILTALKVFAFDSDEGVSGQLGRLAALVERESQMRATLGFESQKISEKAIAETRDGTKKVTASVDKLLTLEKKKDADTAAQRLLNNIDTSLDMPSEAFKGVQAVFKRYLDSQIPDSGVWLQEDPQYAAWKDTSQPGCSILGLAGNEGFGKSFLFTTIVKELQELHVQSENELECTAAGYYFFDQDKKDESLIRALEVLAWQLAKVDIVYRKDLSSVKAAGINQIGPLCDKLFEGAYKTDSTFFLLLDGLDHMDKQHLKEFVQVLAKWRTAGPTWPRFTLRVLLTARSDTMQKIRTDLEDEISAINIATKNRDDMIKFVNDRMDKMDILSGSSEQVTSLRTEILESLTKETSGDFVQVGLLLDDISGKQRPGEIRDILSRSGENRSDTIVRKIDFLNDSLSEEDISDLNTLLTWVVNTLRPLTLEELEAVLFLKSREPSLRPLGEKIRDQYSSIFRIAAASVYLVSGSIGDYLLEASTSEGEDSGASLDDTGDVNEAEVRIVSRFLNSVCDPQLFKKFGFEEFFQRKLKGKSVRVGIDSETAHLTIVSGCLEVICSEDTPELDALLPYATEYFGEHLEKVDPSLTLPRQKMSLGPLLVKTFTDDDTINRWWRLSNPWLRGQWIYNDKYPDIVVKWLQDSAVTKEISEEQSKWVKSLSSKSESELDADVLEHIGRGLARRWLQSGEVGVAFMFDSVHGYITKIQARKDPNVSRQTSDPGADDIKASEILDAAKWAQEILGLEALDYEESRNLARTLRDYGKYDEALEQFKHTATLSKINWLSQCGMAECYAGQQNWASAIETLETVKKSLSEQIEDAEDLQNELAGVNSDMARYSREAGQEETALEIYQQILKENPRDYETSLEFIRLLHKLERHSGILEFLQSLDSDMDEISGLNLRLTNFHAHYHEEDYHHAMFATVTSEQEFDIMFGFYQESIITAKSRLAKERKAANVREEWALQLCVMELQSRIALLCHKHGAGNTERTKFALEQWLRVLEFNADDDDFIAEKQAIARVMFATVCFENIQRDPENATEWLKQLEHITTTKGDYDGDWFQGKHPACLLARQYALQGDHLKSKDLLRSSIKVHIDLLSDDDPLNDYQGYQGLAIYLMFAGQDADALAAWSLITPNKKDEAEEESADSETPVVLEGSLSDICDGGCDTRWTYADDFYVCKVCNYVSFDKACLDKLTDGPGATTEHICNTTHEKLHVPPYDANALLEIGEGNVKVGDEIMTVDEWLKKIRNDWGLESV